MYKTFIVNFYNGVDNLPESISCNHVDYSDDRYLICKRQIDNVIYIIAIIPHERVVSIISPK